MPNGTPRPVALPLTTDFLDDVAGVAVVACLARYKIEARRHARLAAKADAEPPGRRKERLQALVERVYSDAAQDAEDALAEAVLDLRPPAPALAWENGAAVVQVGGELVVVVVDDLAEDGSRSGRQSPMLFVVPAASQARVVADHRFMIPQWLRDRRDRREQAQRADHAPDDPAELDPPADEPEPAVINPES
jgi:hypothetical protein